MDDNHNKLLAASSQMLLLAEPLVKAFNEAKKGRDMLVALQADPDVAASGLIKRVNRLGLSFDGLFADVEIVADTLKDLLASKQQQAEAAASSMTAFQDALKGKGKRKS